MKLRKVMLAMVFGMLALSIQPARAGIAISIGAPGFFGIVDINGYPAPELVYPEPIVIDPAAAWGPPIYLRVPPYYINDWGRYCYQYNACNRPVYFITDTWYNSIYVPRYRHWHHHPPGPGYGPHPGPGYAPPQPHYPGNPGYHGGPGPQHQEPRPVNEPNGPNNYGPQPRY